MLRIAGVLLLLVVTAACVPAAAPAPSPSPLDKASARQLVLQHELTDVRTGERFTLGGTRGVTVVVNAAMW